MGRYKKLFLLLSFWLLVITILTLSIIPGAITELDQKELLSLRLDYLLHAIAYTALSFTGKISLKFKKQVFLAGFLVLFAIITEFLQLVLPWRAFNYVDMISNVIGVFAGLGLGYLLKPSLQRFLDINGL